MDIEYILNKMLLEVNFANLLLESETLTDLDK